MGDPIFISAKIVKNIRIKTLNLNEKGAWKRFPWQHLFRPTTPQSRTRKNCKIFIPSSCDNHSDRLDCPRGVRISSSRENCFECLVQRSILASAPQEAGISNLAATCVNNVNEKPLCIMISELSEAKQSKDFNRIKLTLSLLFKSHLHAITCRRSSAI